MFIFLLVAVSILSAYSNIMIVHMADEQTKVLALKFSQSLDRRDVSFDPSLNPMEDISWQDPISMSMIAESAESNSGFGELNRLDISAVSIRTLEDLAGCEEAFGTRGFIIVSIIQLLFSFSLMCIALGVFTDTVYNVDSSLNRSNSESFFDALARSLPFVDGRSMVVLMAVTVLLPLCLLKRSLKTFQSFYNLALLLMMISAFAAAACFMYDGSRSVDGPSVQSWLLPQPWGGDMRLFWSPVLIIVFCYAYSQKVFKIYSSMRGRTPRKWTRAMSWASACVLGFYLSFGVLGCVALQLQGTQLQNFNFFGGGSDVTDHQQHVTLCVIRSPNISNESMTALLLAAVARLDSCSRRACC